MITIAITGASGNMGIEAVNELLKLGTDHITDGRYPDGRCIDYGNGYFSKTG